MATKPIAILYEHPQWFQPLFTELERRGIDYEKIHLFDHYFDPCAPTPPYSLLVNRVSAYPSATIAPQVVLYVKQYLACLERLGTRVINGGRAYEVGASKALQMQIFSNLELNTPNSRVIHHPGQAPEAAKALRFPVLIKPNVGGSGVGIKLYKSYGELAQSVDSGSLELGTDQVALVQEYLKPKGDCIYRVEVLNGAFLYGIRLPIVEENFNYCPADGCNVESFNYCPRGEPDPGNHTPADPSITAFEPSVEIIEKVRQAMVKAGADLGGVEYLINADDDRPYFYDLNPLSNFVANAKYVVGFDPVPRLADFILQQANCLP